MISGNERKKRTKGREKVEKKIRRTVPWTSEKCLIPVFMIIALWLLPACFSLPKTGRVSTSDKGTFVDDQRASIESQGISVRDQGIRFRSIINPIVVPGNFSCSQRQAALIFSAFLPYSSQTLASECTAIFQKALLKQRVFKVTNRFSAQDESEKTLMDRVREKGFDLLVVGRVTDFFLLREPGHPGLRFPLRFII